MNEDEQRDMIRAVFDALPSIVLVVDPDVRVQEYNAAAFDLLMAERKTILKLPAGEILNCVHSREAREGCGQCSVCGKVRDDQASWMRVESYFKTNWDVDFSHGFCPDCFKIEKDKLKSFIKAERMAPANTDESAAEFPVDRSSKKEIQHE